MVPFSIKKVLVGMQKTTIIAWISWYTCTFSKWFSTKQSHTPSCNNDLDYCLLPAPNSPYLAKNFMIDGENGALVGGYSKVTVSCNCSKYTDAYSEPRQTSTMEYFAKIVLKAVNYFF